MTYRCDTCRHEFRHQPRRGTPLPRCPRCGGFTRRLGGPAIRTAPDPYERMVRDGELVGSDSEDIS